MSIAVHINAFWRGYWLGGLVGVLSGPTYRALVARYRKASA